MRLKYFRGCNSLQELKKEYKKLLKINHPDNGGDLVTMQEINAEYAKLEKSLPDIELDESQDARETRETRQNYTSADISPVLQAVMNRLSTIPGIEVEICGTWIWVSGNTFPIKQTLKEIGLKFSGKKKMWYFREEKDSKNTFFRKKKEMDMSHIRTKYGSFTYENTCTALN